MPAITVNKVCLSGINAIYLADQMIQAGDAEVVVAGGMESMTNAPYLLPGARAGYRMGNGEVVDSLIHDGLWCAFDAVHMGTGTEQYVGQVGGITREQQDELAAKSHERAAAAQKEGRFADEIAPVAIPQRKGDPIVVDTDEGVRPGTTTESLGGLRPAFSKDGTITAGNASQISDGAAAVVMMSRAKADELGVTPLAELVGYGMVAGPDPSLLTPAVACDQARARRPRPDRLRRRPVRAQRGVRRGRPRVDEGPRHHRRHRQRQRRRDRARSPDRHVGHARRAHAHQRAAPPRRRHRCRGAVRRWRPGRRRDHPHAVDFARVSRMVTFTEARPHTLRVAALGLLAAGVAWNPPAHPPLLCPLRTLTGIPCPFCGMTRAGRCRDARRHRRFAGIQPRRHRRHRPGAVRARDRRVAGGACARGDRRRRVRRALALQRHTESDVLSPRKWRPIASTWRRSRLTIRIGARRSDRLWATISVRKIGLSCNSIVCDEVEVGAVGALLESLDLVVRDPWSRASRARWAHRTSACSTLP